LPERFPAQAGEIRAAFAAAGLPADQMVYLPLVARRSFWTVLLDARSARIVGYIPLDTL
jgi:hypothetical protein